MNTISVEYGDSRIRVQLPLPCDELGMGAVAPLADPAAAIRAALDAIPLLPPSRLLCPGIDLAPAPQGIE